MALVLNKDGNNVDALGCLFLFDNTTEMVKFRFLDFDEVQVRL